MDDTSIFLRKNVRAKIANLYIFWYSIVNQIMLSSVKTLLDQSWEIYKKRFGVFLGIIFLPIIVFLLLGIFLILMTILLDLDGLTVLVLFASPLGLGIMLILTFVSFVGGLWSQTSLLCAIKDREENIGIKESYRRGWSKIISYFWISFLSGIIISGGLFLFFVPGLIFFIWFGLASFVFISENKKGWSALMASKEYVRGNWLAVFWRFLCLGVIAWLFLLLPTIIASFAAVPSILKIYFSIGYILIAPMAG